MQNILLIYPNTDSQPGFNYGLAHIAALLKKHGHKVTLWHLCEELHPLPEKREFLNRLQEIAPDIIGFSVVTNQWPYTRKLAAWIREISGAKLVCGGVHVLAEPDSILQSGLFDYIFRGEAEEAFLEFVNQLDAGRDVRQVRNLGFMDQNGPRLNPIRPLPLLENLPPKDYSVFDFQKLIDVKHGWVGLMTSRGCPFSCTYCFNHQMVAQYKQDLQCQFKDLNYIRHFPVEMVISEIKYLLQKYANIRMFILDDDLFTFNKDYVLKFCREYAQTTRIPFVVNAHVNFFEQERAALLAKANCKIVKFGVESGSERVRREILNRRMKNDRIVRAIKTAEDFGLHSSVFLMLGLPGETRDELMQTIKLMSKCKPGRYRWSFFFPFPGTRAHEIAWEKGYIDRKKMLELPNFTGESCLDFGEEHNLLLQKVGKIMPWFVNAYSDLPVAAFYRRKVEEIVDMDQQAWQEKEKHILQEDQEISEQFVQQGQTHYAIKFNPFMGVISDYFTAEE